MTAQEHESHIAERDGKPDLVAAIAVVVVLVLAFLFFFSWNGRTAAIDVATGTMQLSDG